MPTQKKGYKNIVGSIPEEMYDAIKTYNKVSLRELNVSKTIEGCLAKEVEKIRQEAVENFKELGKGFGIGNIEMYDVSVKDLEEGKSVAEVYKTFVQKYIDTYVSHKDLEEKLWLRLVIPDRMHLNKEKEEICFFVGDIFVCKLYSLKRFQKDLEKEL